MKVANNDGSTDAQKVAQGIIWAADHKADVINISIVFTKEYPMLKYAVDYAWDKGCLIIAAAGNSGKANPVYPAAYPHVIGVSASDADDKLAKWTNRGDWVKVAAPGVNIYSTMPANRYECKSGTSFSAAFVSGEAALLIAQKLTADKNNDSVYQAIIGNSDLISSYNGSFERINVYRGSDI